MKVCTKCQEEKPLSEYYLRGDGKGVKAQCKECTKIARKKHYSNPEKQAMKYASDLKRMYGVTPEEVKEQWELQGECCDICKKSIPLRDFHTHIDHCHTTGKFRGVLCSDCNISLGNMKENTEALKSMIEYIWKHYDSSL